MDPLTVLSVAASVVQFVDFGSRLLQETINVGRGASSYQRRVVTLGRISQELTQLAQVVSEKTAQLSQPGRPRSIIEIFLRDQCLRCSEASGEVLQGVASIIKNKGIKKVDLNSLLDKERCGWDDDRTLGSFRTALELVWKDKKKIDEMEAKVREIKSELMFAMITHMWEQSSLRTHGMGLPYIEPNQIASARQALAQQLVSPDARRTFESFTATPAEKPDENDENNPEDTLPTPIPGSDIDCIKALLDSLRFGSLGARAKAIPLAYQHTFEWIYRAHDSTDEQQNECPDFVRWLQQDSGDVYWITGKPGSGKSTMMKYIVENPRTQRLLNEWSGPVSAHIAWFYSWNAGNDILQKSPEGLLRTLLYQIIEAAPELASSILPARWALLKLFGTDSRGHLPKWTQDELFESIMSMDFEAVDHQSKLAIFVDGLDEFEGDDRDHEALIKMIKKLHSCSGIKVCVSSRPWNTFRDAFNGCPQLRMEKLTQKDLKVFVNGKFRESHGFKDLYDASPDEANKLMTAIISKAEGVFLWVSIVTNMILEGLRDGERLESLKPKIDELPSDLGKLYTSLRRGIKPEYKPDGARLLILFETFHRGIKLTGPKTLSAEKLWLADGDQPLSQAPPSFPQIFRTLTRRLTSRTRTILDISPSGVVDYLHRTARDWIHDEKFDIWREILQWQPKDFDPHLRLLIATSSMASNHKNWGVNSDHPIIPWYTYHDKSWRLIAQCFYHASRMTVRNTVSCGQMANSLDNLAKTLMATCSNRTRDCPMPDWAISGTFRADPLYGFVSLAAEFGLVHYVNFKVITDCRLLDVEGHSDDIIWRLVDGAGDNTFRREFRHLFEGVKEYKFTRQMADRTETATWTEHDEERWAKSIDRIRKIIICDPQERYNLIQEILKLIKTNSQQVVLDKKLRPFYKKLLTDSSHERKTGWCHAVTVPFVANDGSIQKKRIRFADAIVELLESYDVGNSTKGSGFRAWWRQKSLKWSAKDQGGLQSPESPGTPKDSDKQPQHPDISDVESVYSYSRGLRAFPGKQSERRQSLEEDI